MYNEDGIQVEEQPKKKGCGCAIFAILLFIIPSLLFAIVFGVIIFGFISLSGGVPDEPLTINSFKAAAEEHGFEYEDVFDESFNLKNAVIAYDGECTITFGKDPNAMTIASLVEEEFRNSQTNLPSSNQISSDMGNYVSYTKTTADTFYFVGATEHSILICKVPIQESEKAKQFLTDVGYYEEVKWLDDFEEKLETWFERLEGASERIEGKIE